MRSLPRRRLVHGPTPLVKAPALDELFGVDLWIKRDDATGGAEAGNKLRKLEFLLGDALAQGADTLLTCGGLQSNHARATAIVAAQHGLKSELFLRVTDDLAGDPREATPASKLPVSGNVLLDRLVGATIHFISRALYAERNAVLAEAAARLRVEGRKPYVIPEGGSNGVGSFGYVDAMREVRAQLDAGLAAGPRGFDAIVHACGSGGTAAGVAVGAGRYEIAPVVMPVAVCDDAAYFEATIDRIVAEMRGRAPELAAPVPVRVHDRAKGPAYAETSEEQRRFLVRVARRSGHVFDPVYTGKALFGLEQMIHEGWIGRGSRVLFLHTGGLPGLLAAGASFEAELT